MSGSLDWRRVHALWFPPGLEDADTAIHARMFERWFAGGLNAALAPFASFIEAARSGRLDDWLAVPRGRLSLILVLDQFPRALFAGTQAAYACDADALRIAEAGLRNGQYDALATPWERTFFFLPLAHAEGPDHRERLERAVALAEAIARDCPEHLRPLYQHSANQARGHLAVVSRFGRFPHRNPILKRVSTPEEEVYLAEGNFVHMRRPAWPGTASAEGQG